MTDPQLSIIIVTWNAWELTRRTMRSIHDDTGSARIECIVVDNGSMDETAAGMAREFPGATYLRLDKNHGFAVGNNRGVAVAHAPLLFLLNNDTIVQPGTIKAILDAADAQTSFNIFAVEMLRMDQPEIVDNRGLYLDITARFRQVDAGGRAGERHGVAEVYGASGGAAIIRRSVIDEVGLFDESLESYLEDCDFACKARGAGHRCLYVSGARILHEGSATGKRVASHKAYLIVRNGRVLHARWTPFHALRLSSWLGVAYTVFQVARAALAGHFIPTVRAWRDAGRLRGRVVPTEKARERVQAWVGRAWRRVDAANA